MASDMQGESCDGGNAVESSDPKIGVSDEEILQIAKSISDEGQIQHLGIKLCIAWAEVERFLQTNHKGLGVSYMGTKALLNQWREKTYRANQRGMLKQALIDVQLVRVAERFFSDDHAEILQNSKSLPSSQVARCRENLNQHYLEDTCKIKTSPLDPKTYVELDNMFVNLRLLKRGNKRANISASKIPLNYEEIFTKKVNGILPSRIAIVGDAGVGKTTLLAKIAYDWAHGHCLKDVSLLILIFLRDTRPGESVGQIVKRYLSDSNSSRAEQLDEYIRTNPKKVIVMFDGFDEFRGGVGDIKEILSCNKLKSCRVLVTTRPSSVNDITTSEKFSKRYAVIHIDGFSKQQVEQYIGKYFIDDMEAGRSLVQFTEEDSLLPEGMTSFPVFCALLCNLWAAKKGRKSISDIETYHQLFKAMVYHLKEHLTSKSEEKADEDSIDLLKVNTKLKEISFQAFDGLLHKQLEFGVEDLKCSEEAVNMACKVGILNQTKRVAPLEVRRNSGKRYHTVISFPHKLLQEFFASLYLVSLYKDQQPQFNAILQDKILEDFLSFQYLFYFTSGDDEDPNTCNIGKLMIEGLRSRGAPSDLIVDTAFECHKKDLVKPLIKTLLAENQVLTLHDGMDNHTISSYLFAMDAFDPLVHVIFRKTDFSRNLSQKAAATVFTIKSIRQLTLDESRFDTCFFDELAKNSRNSKIDSLTLKCQETSCEVFCSLLTLPCLQALKLDEVVAPSDESTALNKSLKPMISRVNNSVTNLDVDDSSLALVCEFGLPKMCPQIQKVTLRCNAAVVSSDIIDYLKFTKLVDVRLEGSTEGETRFADVTSICNMMTGVWKEIGQLTICGIEMTDQDRDDILKCAEEHTLKPTVSII